MWKSASPFSGTGSGGEPNEQGQVYNGAAAAAMVENGDTVAISGNGAGMISAETIFAAVEKRFLETGEPRDLTLVHSLGLGDRGELRNQPLRSRGNDSEDHRFALHVVGQDAAADS